MISPRDRAFAAYQSGATTRREIVAATRLDPDLVDLIVDVLIKSGEISLQILEPRCKTGSCRGCWQSKECTSRKDAPSTTSSLGMPLMPN